jgi:regulator of protease activity HflC (stomatin/prohibitin superfamily)
MERNIQKIGLVNLWVLLAGASASFVLARLSASFAGQTASAFIGLGFLIAAVSYFQIRLENRERLEKLEFDELSKSRGGSALFATEEAELFAARRAREQFERFMVPAFTVILFLLQAGGAFLLWRWLEKSASVELTEPLVAMALFGLFALVLFLLGKYSAGIARLEGQRLLRPGASYLLLGAYLCFVVVASVAAVEAGFPRVDLYAARALCVLLALNALETMVNLILEIYRPRVKGQQARLLYESRLVGLLSQPEGLITTAAQALDYQFGFKVSDTWFYRFLEKALAWLILLQLGALLFSTCFIFMEPGQEGLLERFGRPVEGRQILQPGAHLKFPWPIDRVIRYNTQQIQSFNVGFIPDPVKEKESTVLWTVPHYKEEFNLLVASRDSEAALATTAPGEQAVPVSLLTVGIPVHYQISNVRRWAYEYSNAGELLEKIATREVVRYLVGVDLNEIMSTARQQMAEVLRQRIQDRANELDLGVKILFLGLQDIHPPVKVAPYYEAVVAAIQEKEARILEAQAYSSNQVPVAAAKAKRKVLEAEAYRARKVPLAEAQKARFTNQMAAYQASPTIFSARSYFQTMARGASEARKYILAATNTQDVLNVNLEDKIYKELMDAAAGLSTPGGK